MRESNLGSVRNREEAMARILTDFNTVHVVHSAGPYGGPGESPSNSSMARVATSLNSAPSRRVWQSSGLHQERDPAYENDAIRPRPPWSLLSPEASREALAKAGVVLRVAPEAVATVTRTLREVSLKESSDAERVRPRVTSALEVAARFACDLSSATSTLLGAWLSQPGLMTVTRNRQGRGQFIGLHLDNWDCRSVASRRTSRNRLVVNLGPGRRQLVFVPSSEEILEEIADEHLSREWIPGTNDVRTFVSRRSGIPALMVEFLPGDFYIAPTEVLIHDGATIGSASFSVVVQVLGRYPTRVDLPEQPALGQRANDSHAKARTAASKR